MASSFSLKPVSEMAKISASSGNPALRSRDIFGVPVLAATIAEALAYLDDRLQDGAPACVGFLNANTSNVAADQPRLAALLRDWVIFCDGIGADIASRVLHGVPFPENLNGTDFVPHFLRNTRHILRVFTLGGRPDVLQRALDEFRRQAPQHQYVGSQHGYYRPDEAALVINAIKRADANVILVALGTPLQEYWLADHFAATGCRLGFAVGGLLDFVSGEKPRAPLWLRGMRLEWTYRLILEPQRMWRRYILGNAIFLWRVARAAVTR